MPHPTSVTPGHSLISDERYSELLAKEAELDRLRPILGILRRCWPEPGRDWSVRLTAVETDVIRRAINSTE